ncbi:MAG: T9SS type A sorting domain-containing protein [Flavobacteriales bacterium]|nr:T9SS type A sorting domain-containing protein [Flavobacteriales bacterium]
MKNILALIFSILCWQTYAQQYSNIIIANGGQFELAISYADRATIGVYNPVNQQYWIFDTIQVESVQDVIVDGNYVYLAASDSIIKYDLTTYERVGQVYFAGIRSLSIHDTLLFVGRFFGTGDYLEVFNKNDLTSIFSIPEVNNTVYGVQVVGDSVYVPYNEKGSVDQYPPFGVFNDTLGKIAVIDLVSQSFVRDIELDTIGAGVKAIYNYNNQLYVVCEANGVIAHYDPINDTTIFNAAGVTRGIAQVDSLIYVDYTTGVGSFDIKNMQVVNNSIISTGFYASGALDTLNDNFYINTTDYTSYGKSYIYDFTGNLTDSFDVNTSPEAIDIDYKTGNYGPIALRDYQVIMGVDYLTVLDNDFDPNGDALIITVLTDPTNGTAVVENDSILYTPTLIDTDYLDSLQYQICDGSLCDSAWAFINVDGANGIMTISEKTINLYPNPTSGLVKIEGVENGIYSIIDINGRLLQFGVVKNNSMIDITGNPTGVYFVQITHNQNTATVKLIKY